MPSETARTKKPRLNRGSCRAVRNTFGPSPPRRVERTTLLGPRCAKLHALSRAIADGTSAVVVLLTRAADSKPCGFDLRRCRWHPCCHMGDGGPREAQNLGNDARLMAGIRRIRTAADRRILLAGASPVLVGERAMGTRHQNTTVKVPPPPGTGMTLLHVNPLVIHVGNVKVSMVGLQSMGVVAVTVASVQPPTA